jgi:hypothetical protein
MLNAVPETAAIGPTFGVESCARGPGHAWLACTLVGLLGTLYFGWTWHRLSERVLVADNNWPRPWPYPDRWLSAVEQWFDARNPAPADNIKIHGEFDRVRFMNLVANALSLEALVVGAVMFKRRRLKRSVTHSSSGGTQPLTVNLNCRHGEGPM